MLELGTKLYYCVFSGDVILVIGDSRGFVKETTFTEDYLMYPVLNEREKDTIGVLKFNYGTYPEISKGATSVSVDLKTKQPVFSYNEIPKEPTDIELIKEKVTTIEQSQSVQDTEIVSNMLATTELFEMVLVIASSPTKAGEFFNTKNKGGNNMVEVYVTLIIKGHKTLEDVPAIIRPQVEERLRQLEIPVK